MNEDLISQIKEVVTAENQEKLIKIIQLLESSNYELRGKINPDLQLSASALVFNEDKLFFIEHPYQK